MRVLVTGGAGFIGSHIADALVLEGHDVFVVDNLSSGKREQVPAKATFIEGDVRRLDALPLPSQIDVIFHLAAQIDVRHSVEQPAADADINVLGTLQVLELAKKTGAKVVFSSTGGAIYGSVRSYPTPERIAPRPSSPYGLAKFCAERYIQLYHELFQVPYVILRYGNVYGPRQGGSKETGVIAIFCQKALTGEPLTVFGNGKQTRDFVYVGDVVRANLAAMKLEAGIFNIASGTETSVNELTQLIQQASGKALEINHVRGKKGEVKRSCLAIAAAKQGLGWRPSVSLQQGIEQTLASMSGQA